MGRQIVITARSWRHAWYTKTLCLRFNDYLLACLFLGVVFFLKQTLQYEITNNNITIILMRISPFTTVMFSSASVVSLSSSGPFHQKTLLGDVIDEGEVRWCTMVQLTKAGPNAIFDRRNVPRAEKPYILSPLVSHARRPSSAWHTRLPTTYMNRSSQQNIQTPRPSQPFTRHHV